MGVQQSSRLQSLRYAEERDIALAGQVGEKLLRFLFAGEPFGQLRQRPDVAAKR